MNESMHKLYEESIQLQKEIVKESNTDVGRCLNRHAKLRELNIQINKRTVCRLANRTNTIQ